MSARATGLAAGGGLFLSTTVLMTVGAASVGAATAAGLDSDNPVANYTGLLPGWLAVLTLVAIAVGAVAANVLNVYFRAMAFLALGIALGRRCAGGLRRQPAG